MIHETLKPMGSTTGARYARRNHVLREMGFPSYRAYQRSELWKTIRRQVIERDKGQCVICNRRGHSVHHVTYSREVMEGKRLDQLALLCRGCHVHVEFKDGNKLFTTHDVTSRTAKKAKRVKKAKKLRPACVVCGLQKKNVGRDDICMECYRSGRALTWRQQQAAVCTE